MAVIVTCKCGQSFKAREDLLGKRVACPSCNQPLDIPTGEEPAPAPKSAASKSPASKSPASKPREPKPAPAPASVRHDPLGKLDDPLSGLGDAAGFEQSASLATNSAGQIIAPGYAGRGHVEEGFSKQVVVAMWIGGGAVGLMLIAMLITAIIGVGEPDPEPADGGATTTASASGSDDGSSDEETDDSPADDSKKSATKKSDQPATAPATSPSSDDAAESEPTKPSPKPAAKPAGEPDAGKKKDAEPAAPKPAEVSITLSAGTALPQSLAGGTVIMVSVDYRFAKGQPDPAVKYLWVVEAADGETAKEPVELEPQGNLTAALPDFRPEQAPFQTYIEDPHGKRIASPQPLK